MGRLQKKKTSKSKKKSSDAALNRGSYPKRSDTVVKSPVSSVKAEKKQKTTGVRKPASVSRIAPAKQNTNLINKSAKFLREVIIELKKVTWPGRKQTIGSTVVVLILVTIIAFFLGTIDIGLSFLVKIILQ